MKVLKSKKIPLIILMSLILSVNTAFAEKESGISGQVKDAETKKPVEFCTVIVSNPKDSITATAITDEKGFFTIPLTPGKYKIITKYIGYKTDTLNVFVKTGNEFIGIIKLKKDENQISEVTVTGESVNILTDKNEYIVTAKMKTGAANTKDVLDKVEGITYDRYNNTIKVDNEDNIVILVNGLKKDPEYILNLDPDRLKKIEVVRDPSGRYALEGYSAIINIILKDNYKGLEFYSEDHFILDPDNKNKDYFPLGHFTQSINYTYNKINIYGKINNSIMNFNLLSYAEKNYDNGLKIEKTPQNQTPNFSINRIFDKITAGIDFYVSPKQTISFETGFTGYIFPETEQKSEFNVEYFNSNIKTDNFKLETINLTANKSNYNTLFYKGIIDNKNTLNIDMTYSASNEKYTITNIADNILLSEQKGINDNKYTIFNAELDHVINEKSSFQIGYGNTWKKVTNTFNFNETKFIRTDFRNKLYLYYSLNINKKIGIKLGMAGETSTPEIENKKLTYFIYQPYADIKISPVKMLDIKLKYRSSSNYPSVTQANPDTVSLDETTVSVGNPYLEPSVTHKLSIRFNVMHGLISLEPYYHFSENYISKTGYLNDKNIFVYSYENAGKYEHYGLKAGLTVPFGKSIFWQNNADFFRSSIFYDNRKNSIKDWTMSSNLIYVNKKYKTTAGIIYQNNLKKVITAQGYNMWNNDFWGLMVQQPFFKQKMNVMLFYMLPLNIGTDYEQGSYIETYDYTEANFQNIEILKNMIMFRITFRLNKGKSIHKTEKNIKLEEENQDKKGGII